MSEESKLVRIRLFDGPIVEFGEGEVQERFRSKKVGSLLAYLAMRLGRRCPREQISDALWPEESDEQVLSNRLRFTLASLRKQLEPRGFGFDSILDVSISGSVRLREDRVWCDVVEYERAEKEGRSQDAARLLRGPLMPGYYDEWLREDQIRFELLVNRDSKPPPPPPAAPTASSPVVEQRLPMYLTRLFGRQTELDGLVTAVCQDRLVTLTGPGGIGKTRLAVEAARATARSCVFVPLAELGDASRVAEAVLGAFGIAFRGGSSTLDQIASVLKQRPPLLLILDNAEHLVEAVGEFALDLLERVPTLHVLVTSRQRLEVVGERVRSLGPLGAPASGEVSHPAVELFMDRARNVRPDFGPNAQAVEPILAICQKLEGFPLAIELAAVRVTSQSPRQISEDLSASLVDLKSRQRGLAERHRSLRAAMHGSYDLLDASLQAFFRKLSVFEGGWTADAAQHVTEDPEAAAQLEELVIRSLIVLEGQPESESVRYGFLEPLRQFASGLLSDEERLASRQRHSAYFFHLAAKADEEDVRTYLPLDPEQENLIAAFANGDRGDPDFWPGLAGAIEHAFVRGRHRLGLRWIDEFSPEFPTIAGLPTRNRVRNASCQILPDVGRLEAAREMAETMRADALAGGYAEGVAYADVVRGYVSEFVGDMDDALACHRRALGSARSLGNRRLLANCLAHASGTLHDAGVLEPETSEARRTLLQESEALSRELLAMLPPYSRRTALAPLLLATCLFFQGRNQEALEYYGQAEQNSISLGTSTERMYAYVFASEIHFQAGDPERAALLFGAFQALQERMGYDLTRAQHVRPDWITQLDQSLRRLLGDAAYDARLTEGREANPSSLLGR